MQIEKSYIITTGPTFIKMNPILYVGIELLIWYVSIGCSVCGVTYTTENLELKKHLLILPSTLIKHVNKNT